MLAAAADFRANRRWAAFSQGSGEALYWRPPAWSLLLSARTIGRRTECHYAAQWARPNHPHLPPEVIGTSQGDSWVTAGAQAAWRVARCSITRLRRGRSKRLAFAYCWRAGSACSPYECSRYWPTSGAAERAAWEPLPSVPTRDGHRTFSSTGICARAPAAPAHRVTYRAAWRTPHRLSLAGSRCCSTALRSLRRQADLTLAGTSPSTAMPRDRCSRACWRSASSRGWSR